MSADFGPSGSSLGFPYTPPQGGGGGAVALAGDVTGTTAASVVSELQGEVLTITGPLAAGEVLASDAGGTALVNTDIATVLGYDPAANLTALGIPDPTGAPDGQVPTTTSGAYVLAAPAGVPGAVIAEPMTGTGWTTTPMVGTAVTATWETGKLSLSIPSGSVDLSAVTRDATPLDARATQWDVAARVQVTAGDGTTPQGQMILEWHESTGNFFRVVLISNRSILCASEVGASYVDHGLAYGLSSGETTGGQLWLRLSRLADGRIAAWRGVGVAGALPTAWTRTHLVDRVALTAAVSSQATIKIIYGCYGLGPLGATWTVDVLAIRASWRGEL